MNFIREYKQSLKLVEAEEIFDLVFFRPLAFFLVKIVKPFPVTPNMLTMVSMLLGIGAGYLYSLGESNSTILAGLLFLFGNIFDCADGQLARIKGNGTVTGRIVDGIADYVTFIATTIGIGLGYGSYFPSSLSWWIFVVLAGISLAVQAMLLDYYRNEFIGIWTGKILSTKDEYAFFVEEYKKLENAKGHILDKTIIWIYLKYTRVQLGTKSKQKDIGNIDKKLYSQRNKGLMRAWTFIGSTTHISIAIICSLFNRPDIYLWIVISVQNVLAILLYFMQKSKMRTLQTA